MRSLAGFLLFVSFFCSQASADTVTLKNQKEIKGLVVEQHADRIVLSTADGEIPILKKGIKEIFYDAPEQNFMQAGKEYESAGRLGEALAYYQKALELNPDFGEAKSAAIAVRNRFWAKATEGPRDEIEKKQLIYDAWAKGDSPDEKILRKVGEKSRSLKSGLGLSLAKKGDWVMLDTVEAKKAAGAVGLRKGDRLVAIDGRSLRYLTPDVVTQDLLEPRYSSFTLEIERDAFVHKEEAQKTKQLGLKLKLDHQGVVVRSVKAKSVTAAAGVKERDVVVQVDGQPTRYLPLNKVEQAIENSAEADRVVMTVRRHVLLARP